MCLQCLFIPLCVPNHEHTLDENNVLNTVLYYLYAYDVTHNHIDSTSYVGMHCLKRKIMVCINALNPFLSVFCSKYLEVNGILVDNNILEQTFIFDSFLYYLFAYDNIYASLGIFFYGGRKIVGWSTWLSNNTMWVLPIFDQEKLLWIFEPLEAPPLMCFL